MIKVEKINSKDCKADFLVVGQFDNGLTDDGKALNKVMKGALSAEKFNGDFGKVRIVTSNGKIKASRVLLQLHQQDCVV